MPAPAPTEIFDRAADEGERRLEQSMLELVATSFIAGFTIVFGIAALGIGHAAAEASFGEIAKIVGALSFGVGLVLPVMGRVELFNENFFDPAAAAVKRDGWPIGSLMRLWSATFLFNLAGGILFVLVLSLEGTLPAGAGDSLAKTAETIAHRGHLSSFASAIAGGALVALLSHLLATVETSGSRIAITYMVGFLLALGPFDHAIVTGIHVVFGMTFGASISLGLLVWKLIVIVLGNVVGGLGLVTVSHVTQVEGAQGSGDRKGTP